MRRIASICILIVLATCIVSCEKEPEAKVKTKNIEIGYYTGEDPLPDGAPSLYYESDGDLLIYYNNPTPKNTAYFLYREFGKDDATILYVGEDRLVFSPLTPSGDIVSPVIVLCLLDGDTPYAFKGEIDLKTDSFNIDTVIPLSDSPQTKAKYNPFDEIRVTVLRHYYDAFNKSAAVCNALEIATLGFSSPVTTTVTGILALTFVAIPTSILYDGAGDDTKREIEQMAGSEMANYFLGIGTQFAVSSFSFEEIRPLMATILKKFVTGLGKVALSENGDAITSDKAEDYAGNIGRPMFRWMRRMTAPPVLFDISKVREEYPWAVSHSVTSIGETYISIKGEARDTSSTLDNVYHTLTAQGFEAKKLRDGSITSFSKPNLDEDMLHLEPATEYAVNAYVITFAGGHKCTSTPERICTRGTKLILSSTDLSFPPEGGTKIINVEIGDCATCSIVGKLPSWCKASYDGNIISVSVKEGKSAENCEITVQTQSSYNETKQATIHIYREGISHEDPNSVDSQSWDGTSWVFKWPSNAPEQNRKEYGDYDITIKSVKKGTYTSYYDTAFMNAGMSASEAAIVGPSQMWNLKKGDNNSIVLYNYNEQYILGTTINSNFEHTIKRLGKNTATMEWTYREYRNGKLSSEEIYILNGERK